jgi:exosortase D (VPLPA-CTERM-specific)
VLPSDALRAGLRAPGGLSLAALTRPGPLWLFAALGAAALYFHSGLASLGAAWATPEYSHGPVVPLVSLFLFLREMRDVPPTAAPVTDRWPGLALMFVALAVGFVGNATRIDDITTYGFVLWVGGLVLVCFGFRRGLAFWPSVLHLIFMLPLPQFVYWQVSVALQLISSQLGVAMIRLADMPVFLDGNIIDLGIYKLQVAEACSGLSYLFPMLSFSYTFAVLYRGPVWHKLTLLAMAVPITVAMNSFRIGVIGIMVRTHGIEYAEGFLHFFEGWVIFVSCMAILIALAWTLQRLVPRPLPLREALDIDFEGVGEQFARIAQVPATRVLMGAALVTALAATVHLAPERTRTVPPRDALVTVPQVIDGRTAQWMTLERQIEQVLGADDYVSALYLDRRAGPPVDLFAAWYASQTEGEGIHSPEVCLPTGGWEVSGWSRRTVSLPGVEPFEVNRAVIQKGTARQIVWFWFEQRGKRIASDYAVKAHAVIDEMLYGRSDGGLVRLTTPIGPGETEATADARLEAFLGELMPALPRFFPD